MKRTALFGIHGELLVRHDKFCLEPAGRVQDEVRARHERRPQGTCAFARSLCIGNLRRAQLAAAAKGYSSRTSASGKVEILDKYVTATEYDNRLNVGEGL